MFLVSQKTRNKIAIKCIGLQIMRYSHGEMSMSITLLKRDGRPFICRIHEASRHTLDSIKEWVHKVFCNFKLSGLN